MNTWKVWTIVGAAAVLLAGCGVPGGGNGNVTNNQTAAAGTPSASGPSNGVGNASGSSNTTNSTSQQSPGQEQLIPAEKDVSFQLEGNAQTQKAKLYKSSQGYYMYILNDYLPSAIEPGVDGVMFKLNNDELTQITMLSKDANLDEQVQNAKQYLQATGPVEQVDPASANFLPDYLKQHVVAFVHAVGQQFSKQILFLQVDGVLFKVMIQSPIEFESVNREYAMIATIGVLDAK